MIFPENRETPPSVVIITLWGTAASALEKAILKGSPAGAVSVVGANVKSLASIETITGADVGCGVDFGVGRGVGFGVGFDFGVGLGIGVTEGFRVGVGEGRALDEALGDATGEAVGSDVSIATDDALGPAELDGAIDSGRGESAWLDAPASDSGTVGSGAGAPHAATTRTTTTIRRVRAEGIAAL